MIREIRERSRSEEGFTLIELLVVMIIIAILMAVAVPTFLGQKNNAQKSKATSNIKQIVNAIESCAVNNTDGGYQGCVLPTDLKRTEKGLNSITDMVSTGATTVSQYGIVPTPGASPQGYAVSTAIKDGDKIVFFTEVHGEDGTLLKGCGTAALAPSAIMSPTTGVPDSRTCTNGKWG